MSKIAILTDSCCDLPKETIEELGIKVLPFEITFDGETFREIFDKSTYEEVEAGVQTEDIKVIAHEDPDNMDQSLAVTSLPNTGEMLNYDNVIIALTLIVIGSGTIAVVFVSKKRRVKG